MKLLTFSCVSLEGAKASQTTAKWVVEYAPLAQVVHEPKRACPEQPRSGAWRRAEQLLATERSRKCLAEGVARIDAPLAQLVEQLTLNQWVPGSSP